MRSLKIGYTAIIIFAICTSCRDKAETYNKNLSILIMNYLSNTETENERGKILDEIKELGYPAIDLMLKDLKICSQNLDMGSYTVIGSALILGELHEESAKPMLIKLLQSNFPGLRLASALSLCKLGDKEGPKALVQILRTASNYAEKRDALIALGRYGKQENIPAIKEIINRENDPDLIRLGLKSISKIYNNERETSKRETFRYSP